MRLKKKKKNIETRYLILILIFSITIFFGILSLTIDDNRSLSFFETVIKDSVVGIQKIIYHPFRYFEKRYIENKKRKETYHEYINNKSKLEKYELISTENINLRKEIASLQDLLNVENLYSDYDIVNASVINRNIGDWFNTMTINKGNRHGLKEGMLVINENGMIGRLIKITNFTSEVKLITTSLIKGRISASVINQNNDITYGLISGYNKETKHILMEDIIDDSNVEKGNHVMTSGLSDIFPKGIYIGKVEAIKSDEFGISKILLIKSDVDFNDIRYVSILKRKENNDN